MQYNLAHASPEVVTGRVTKPSTVIDATAHDTWGVGVLFLTTVTGYEWFVPEQYSQDELDEGVEDLQKEWVS